MARYGRQGPVAMGGWLAVLVVTLALFAGMSLVMAGSLARDALNGKGPMADPRFHRYLVGAALLALIRSAGYAFVAWRLVGGRTRWEPRVAIAGIWLMGPGLWLASGPTASWAALAPILYAAIWTAYLLRSDRVANTYAAPHDNLADVFG